MSDLKARLIAQIGYDGPLTIAQFMAAALYDPASGYYANRAGVGADFLTAPEASQMFGELIGAWCAHEWTALGAPETAAVIELGGGTGALMADAWRAIRTQPACAAACTLHMVEINPGLIARQTATLAQVGARVQHHARLDDAPFAPSLIIANEFLDCFPIRQLVKTDAGWRERVVGVRDGALAFGLAPDALADASFIPPALRDAPAGSVYEWAPSLPGFVAALAARLRDHPGRILLIDYGADAPTLGDTLQALREHRKVDPLDAPGEADLTAHVDFSAVRALALREGLAVYGPTPQGLFLDGLGLSARAAALARARPDRADTLARQVHRLADPAEMGALFKVLCLTTSDLSPPAGFSPI